MNVNAQWMALDYGVDFGARTLVYDSASSKLFVGGNFRYASGILTNGIAVWDGASWDSLGRGFQQGAPVYRLYMYRDTLLASSIYYPSPWPDEGAWLNYWNGSVWDTFPSSTNSAVGAFKEYNNTLYVGGAFSRVGMMTANLVFKYTNGISTPMNLPTNNDGYVLSIEFYHDSLFVAGNFYDTLTQTNDLEVWNGTQFQRVGGYSFPFGSSTINSLKTYDDKLFVGGHFQTSFGNYLLSWDGQNFSDAGMGLDGPIWNMKIYDGQLYVCGGFYQIGGVAASGIARWDGQQWHPVVPFFHNTLISDFEITPAGLYLVGGISGPVYGALGIVLYTGVVGTDESTANSIIRVIPNPANSRIVFYLSVEATGLMTLYNSAGAEISSFPVAPGNDKREVEAETYPSGIYYWRFVQQDGSQQSGKFSVIN